MKYTSITELPIAANVCDQILREVEKQPTWSMAHVTMNPRAKSLPHFHRKMTEVYAVTRGFGALGLGEQKKQFDGVFARGSHIPVMAGSVLEIPPQSLHLLENKSMGQLEHLVFAFPPFNAKDVHVLPKKIATPVWGVEVFFNLPDPENCFDGAKILPYSFPDLDISITFGWVTNDDKRKKPHFHKKTTEWIYVVEGEGTILIDGDDGLMNPGDWFQIDPREPHAMRSNTPENLVVVCVCFPAFDMNDVYY